MLSIPQKIKNRFTKEVSNFQKILKSAKDRDVNESDTVMIITDMLSSVFGFDRYAEITSEQAIRGTYCDLAVKVDGTIKYLIEVKAIGLQLKENHLRQVISYGANNGVPWIVLTNGIDWEVHKILFEKPIQCEMVATFSFLDLNPRKIDDQQLLFVLCREGLSKAAIQAYHERARAVNRFAIGAVVLTDPVLDIVKRELRRISPELKISNDEIRGIIKNDVLKREVADGENATKARARVKRAANNSLRKVKKRTPRKKDSNTTAPQEEAMKQTGGQMTADIQVESTEE